MPRELDKRVPNLDLEWLHKVADDCSGVASDALHAAANEIAILRERLDKWRTGQNNS